MKIGFLVYTPQAKVIYDWKNLRRYNDYILNYNRDHYFLIKALEQNKEFEKEVLKARKILNIPEKGYTAEYYVNKNDLTDFKSGKELLRRSREITKFSLDVREVSKRIIKKLQPPNYIRSQMEVLICGNFVAPTYQKISIIPKHRYIEDGKTYFITIAIEIYSKLSKNEFVRYINENWKFIEKEMAYLKPDNTVYVSNRDLRIIELRDKEKLKYKNIADRIESEFGNNDFSARINEDSVKTAYKRAKNKISGLTKS